jgi:hypothetical protein
MKNKSSKIDAFVYEECHSAWFSILKSTQGFTKNKTFSEKERFLIFMCKPDFINEVEKIRESFGIPKSGFSLEDEAEKWIEKINKQAYEKQTEETKKLLINFKIHPRWEECVKYFLLFNKDDIDHILPAKIDCRLEWDEEYGIARVKLEIYSDTKIAYIQKERKLIEEYIKLAGYAAKNNTLENTIAMLTKKGLHFQKQKDRINFKSYTEFKKYKMVFDLRETGLEYKTIAERMGWMKSDYNRVGTYIAKFKKALAEAVLM